MKMNSVEIQAVFPTVAAEEPPKKRRRSSGSAQGKGTCTPLSCVLLKQKLYLYISTAYWMGSAY